MSETAERRTPTTALRCGSPRLVIGAIVAIAFAVRLAGATYGLPAEFRPDEIYIVNRSLGILAGQYDSTFFFWPSLYYWLIAPVYLVGLGIGAVLGLRTGGASSAVLHAVSDPQPYILAIRLIGVVCGALLPIPVYMIGRHLQGRFVGIAAAAITALAFVSVRESHFGLQDGPAALAVAFAVYAGVRAYTSPPPTSWLTGPSAMRWWTNAGLLAGVAFALKFHPGLVIVPIMVMAVRRGVVPAATAAVAAIATGTLLQPELFMRPGDVISGLFTHTESGEASFTYYLQTLLPAGLGLPLMTLAAVGTVRVVVRPRLIPISLALHALVILLVLGRAHAGYGRYMLPLLPDAAILAALAADWLRTSLGRLALGGVATAGAAAVVALALIPTLFTDVCFDRLATGLDTRATTYNWALAHVPPNARVATSYFGGIFHSVAWAATFNPTTFVGPAREIVDNRVGPWREVLMDDQDQLQIAETLRPSQVDYIVLSSMYPHQRFEKHVRVPSGFHIVFHIQPLDPSAQPQYDRYDGLYIPIAAFAGVREPGPAIYVFQSDRCSCASSG